MTSTLTVTRQQQRQHTVKPTAKNPVRAKHDQSIDAILDELTYSQLIHVCHSVLRVWTGEEYAINELPNDLKSIAVKIQNTLDQTQSHVLEEYVSRRIKERTKHIRPEEIPLLKELNENAKHPKLD